MIIFLTIAALFALAVAVGKTIKFCQHEQEETNYFTGPKDDFVL